MEVVKEIKNTKNPIIMVITGNGRAEFRRPKLIAKKYNDEKILWFPLTSNQPNRNNRNTINPNQPKSTSKFNEQPKLH